jgi:hypothetical protein
MPPKPSLASSSLYRAAWSCCQTVLSAVLSEAVELGAIRTNPAVRLRLPAPPRRDNQIVLTTEEITGSRGCR